MAEAPLASWRDTATRRAILEFVAHIWARPGRRPAIACGNSNGDLEMLRFAGGAGKHDPGRRRRGAQSSALIANATAKPSVVASPTSRPPCSKASGIIVSASIVRIAPPANACTKATLLPEASSKSP
jgi:hypothetical protein